MIDTKNHFSINGVLYRAAEDAEGNHYILSGEPLRPPNAVMVQGEDRQDKFQSRPDMLLWNITDWSGGEGQIVFDSQAQSRQYVLQSVDPFVRPGTLTPGYAVVAATDSVPSALSINKPVLAFYSLSSVEGLALFSSGTVAKWWVWDATNGYFTAQTNYSGLTNGPQHVVADESGFYLGERATTKVWTLAATGGAASALTTSTITANSTTTDLALMGDYLYQIDWAGFTVYEIDKTTGAATSIDTALAATHGVDTSMRKLVCAGSNRLYVALPTGNGNTTVREIVPTSAAGPGYGREIASYPSFWATSLWYHQGTLFIGGSDHPSLSNQRALLYHIPGGQYGALGRPRVVAGSYPALIQGNDGGNNLTETVFLLGDGGLGGASALTRVFLLDTISGGYAEIANAVGDSGLDAGPPFRHQEDVFFVKGASSATGGVYWMDYSSYTLVGTAESPWHDMGLADQKILASLVLSCGALPADWEVQLAYAVDGSTSYTTAGTYNTTSGTGTKFTLSTGTSTVKFRTLRVKISLIYTGAGTPTTRPVVYGVGARAQVAHPVPVWQLLLDLSDDHSGGSQSLSGAAKYNNIKTAGDSEAVVTFLDGYNDRRSGVFTSYDVVVDAYKLVLERPGEGIAAVTLREVV